MKNKEIELHIKNAVVNSTPDIYDRVSSAYVEKIKEENQAMKNQNVFNFIKTRKFAGGLVACIICVMIVFSVEFMNRNLVDTIIDIDVNPSVEIKANKRDKVIKTTALNEDAAIILGGMNLEDVDLEIAINAIIGSMVKHGYISDVKNDILVSVENDNKEKSEQIKNTVVEDINSTLVDNKITGNVYSQPMTANKTLKETAEEINSSVGRAVFFKKVMEIDSSLAIEELAAMSINDIITLLEEKKIELDHIIDYAEAGEEAKMSDETTKEEEQEDIEQLEEADEDSYDDLKEKAKAAEERVKEQAERKVEKAEEATERVKEQVERKVEKAEEATERVKEQIKRKVEKAEEATERVKEQIERKVEKAEEVTERDKEQAEREAEKVREQEKSKNSEDADEDEQGENDNDADEDEQSENDNDADEDDQGENSDYDDEDDQGENNNHDDEDDQGKNSDYDDEDDQGENSEHDAYHERGKNADS